MLNFYERATKVGDQSTHHAMLLLGDTISRKYYLPEFLKIAEIVVEDIKVNNEFCVSALSVTFRLSHFEPCKEYFLSVGLREHLKRLLNDSDKEKTIQMILKRLE